MSRQSRLREIKRTTGPSGASDRKANLTFWSDRASANSLHPGKKAPEATGPGRSDLNHVGESDYLPKVRRGES